MDMLVPIMLIGGFLAVCILVLAGCWLLFRKVTTKGWSALVPRIDLSGWKRFWFTPADPTVLGLIRILVRRHYHLHRVRLHLHAPGFHGQGCLVRLASAAQGHAGPGRMSSAPCCCRMTAPITLPPSRPRPRKKTYYQTAYKEKWGLLPPPPFPTSQDESKYLDYIQMRLWL